MTALNGHYFGRWKVRSAIVFVDPGNVERLCKEVLLKMASNMWDCDSITIGSPTDDASFTVCWGPASVGQYAEAGSHRVHIYDADRGHLLIKMYIDRSGA